MEICEKNKNKVYQQIIDKFTSNDLYDDDHEKISGDSYLIQIDFKMSKLQLSDQLKNKSSFVSQKQQEIQGDKFVDEIIKRQ